jgi:hypothetical protein
MTTNLNGFSVSWTGSPELREILKRKLQHQTLGLECIETLLVRDEGNFATKRGLESKKAKEV